MSPSTVLIISTTWWIAFVTGYMSLPGTPPNLPPQVEVYIDQLMSIKRDIEKRKTPSGEIEVGVWRKMRADHLAHATGYLLLLLGLHRSGVSASVSFTRKSQLCT